MYIEDKKYAKLLADYDKHCAFVAKATAIDINESPQEKQKRIIEVEKDYVTWFEYHFKNTYAKSKCAWFHAEMAWNMIENKNIRLLAEIYRSGAKSVHFDMGIPLYLYLVKNDLKFMLLVGETGPKAAKLLSGIQAQLEHNSSLKNDYGEKFQVGNWAEGDFTTTDGVKFMALGFGQNPRGAREQENRPDYIVVDDVDSKAHVNNDRLMREGLSFILEDVWGCFDSTDDPTVDATERFVFANNNFHKNSITNRLHKHFETVQASQKQNPEHAYTLFKIFKVCAVKDLVNYEPEWPEKTSARYWRNKYLEVTHRPFMREYMHFHIQDGTIFKDEFMILKSPMRMHLYDGLCFYGDMSYKIQGDYKALILLGKKGRHIQELMTYLRKSSRADCASWLYNQYEDFRLDRFNITYLIEGMFSMDEFTTDFATEGDKRGYHIPVLPDRLSKIDKFDRIESLSSFFESRWVSFNADYQTPDQQVLIDQFLAFEKGSKSHDDGPDAFHGAVRNLNKSTRQTDGNYAFGRSESRHY